DPATLSLSSIVNTASTTSTFVTITGSQISGNTIATVVAPYEVSKDGLTGWALTQTFTASSFPTNTSSQKVYVRIKPTVVGAVAASNLTITTVDGVTKTVALSGTGVAAVSDNAALASLTSSNYTLSPLFDAATTSYTASVANTVTSVSMVPILAQVNATIKINDIDVVSGSSGTVQLAVGANSIKVVVTAQDQTTTKTYTIVITRAAVNLATNEVAPDTNGNVTVTTAKPEVKVTSATQPVTVTVPAGTTNATVDYSTLINAPGKATVPKTTINSDISKVDIPASTVFTASNPAWDGVIHAPKIDIWTPPATDDETITSPGLVIELGHPTISFSLSKAVRLSLPAQAGMRAALIHNGVYREITLEGPSDTQAAGDALPTDGAFKINVGADLVIWTKVFSQFITFTQTTDLNVAIVSSDAA
ncbi:MAG: cadherin-like beta sandwich domain-containing protein, partial [Daejeonella sp.]|nr:cadherin-like beta sandwich domain-containing protein [Daejeonella sp.]